MTGVEQTVLGQALFPRSRAASSRGIAERSIDDPGRFEFARMGRQSLTLLV